MAIVASYSYDTWGNLTSASETIPTANGWTNPYRYDGRDGVRYDAADGLYWMSVRAYDPTIGRFIAHDPLGRAPLFFSDQPYAYAGNNPVSNVDPSGQRYAGASGSQTKKAAARQAKTRVYRVQGKPKKKQHTCDSTCKAMNDEANQDLGWGIGKAVAAIAFIAAGCSGTAPFCLAYEKTFFPWLLDGIHGILDALDIYNRYDWGGTVASGWTLFIRAGRVAIDVLQIIMLISDIGDLVKSIWEAKGFFKAFWVVAKAEFTKHPLENRFTQIASGIFALRDMMKGSTKDFVELQESVNACSSSSAHCFG